MRALLSEIILPMKAWTSVLPIVQSALNTANLKRLGNRAPIEAFLGRKVDTPMSLIKAGREQIDYESIEEIRIQQVAKIDILLSAVDEMHKKVELLSTKYRKKRVEAHNTRTNVEPINFDVGHFVMKAKSSRLSGTKLSSKWYGPMKVSKALSNYRYNVRDLLTGEESTLHGSRLKLFRNTNIGSSSVVTEHLKYQARQYFVIDDLADILNHNRKPEDLVKW